MRRWFGKWMRYMILAVLVLSLGGCSGGGDLPVEAGSKESEAAGGPVRIGLCFDSFVIERWLRDRDVFVSTAQSLGAEVNVQNANGEVEEQIEQIRYLISRKMDVIVIIAIDGEALTDVVKEAKNAGIVVISYDRLIREADTDLYISFDNEMVGSLMGEALVEALPEGGKVFEILGSESDNNVWQLKKGFGEAIEGHDIDIVYESFCENWLAELAFDKVNEGLEQTGGKVDGVMCGNDDLAGQAIKALTENRIAGSVPVVAQDAELSACQRIVEGTQTMTVYKSVDEEARIAACFAVEMAQGKDIRDESLEYHTSETIFDGAAEVPCYALEPAAVTKKNMDEVIIGGGFHQKEDVYLNVNG